MYFQNVSLYELYDNSISRDSISENCTDFEVWKITIGHCILTDIHWL